MSTAKTVVEKSKMKPHSKDAVIVKRLPNVDGPKDVVVRCASYEWHCCKEILSSDCRFFESCLSGRYMERSEINLTEDNPHSVHTLLPFLHGDKRISRTIDRSSISGNLISAAMLYVIADKYGVRCLKDAAWDLIELTLTLLRAGAESFDENSPYHEEELARQICEGYFWETPMIMDTFKADSEQGVVDLLDYMSNDGDVVPDELQYRIGDELYDTVATSLWDCPHIQGKLARCPIAVQGFIQRTREVTERTRRALPEGRIIA